MNNQQHLDVARSVGQEGIVLLKNENDFFPINPNDRIRIAVIGENATRMMTIGGGSSELKAKQEISPLQGIKERFTNAAINHTLGYASGPPLYSRTEPSPYDADSLREIAVRMAAQSDIVLYFGGLNKNHLQDCEGGDRQEYGLPFGQDELIEALIDVNPNIGVVLISGNAVEMPWLKDIKGLMQAWYLGSEAGHAIADVISGDVNPSGKLPFSFPVKLEDNSAHYFGEISYPGDSINQVYKDDILVGYRWHDTKEITPQFAFGYGLSYTRFKLDQIAVDKKKYSANDKITITANVTNTGSKEGAEVVQVYIGKPKSKVKRAMKELKGFQKVAVAAGQSTQVNIEVAISDLKYYSESISDWELEPGAYEVYVGTASNRIVKVLKVSVE
ncbi:MAG: glycoside hydrolase family 3 C-terminal domain-containing protein [Cyclobacteriaceae bacterium]